MGQTNINSNQISEVKEVDLVFSDNTTADASISKHGLLKKLSNVATQFLNGVGNWVAIAIENLSNVVFTSPQTNHLIIYDGTNVVNSPRRVNIETALSPSAGATQDINLALGNIFNITMPAGNITLTVSNAVAGQWFMLNITQDATGSRTVTWFSTIRWSGGSAPTLTTGANKRDCIAFRVSGAGTYDGFVGPNI